MKRHPSLGGIFDAVRLTDGPGDDFARHLAECAHCAESAEWIEGILAAVAQGPLPEPTAEALARAISIPETAPRPRRRESTRQRWSLARLVPDAFARPAMAGVRGGPTAQRFLYETEMAHLDLEVATAPGDAERRRLTGQLVIEGSPQSGDVLAVLWRESYIAARAIGDELGVFVLDDVAPGSYRLEVLSPTTGHSVRVMELAVDGAE
jgi:hypothetical protein